jgi:ABC-type nitrate/sulfonate/bicarbonate transport system ATPase subunit
MENMAKSLKSKEMAEIAMRNQKAQSYGEAMLMGFQQDMIKHLKTWRNWQTNICMAKRLMKAQN